MNVVLIGMPGAGKTSAGKLLAAISGRTFFDTDETLAAQFGAIGTIFKERGEAFFRAEENKLCRAVGAQDGLVVATGGGTLLNGDNASILKENGKLIYLRATYATLLSRLTGEDARPLLEGDLAGNLRRLLQDRAAIYAKHADITVDTDGLTVREVAEKIFEVQA